MKRTIRLLTVFTAAIILFAGTAGATIVNPNPAVWNNDTGAALFKPSAYSINIEVYDFLGSLAGTSFGFYFEGNSSSLITVFGPEDQRLSATDPLQSAVINFGTGVVYDMDASAVQSLFTPTAGNIGFYLTRWSTTTLFSESALNPGGQDTFAAFRNNVNPNVYLLGFENLAGTTVYFEVASGITAVPEPSTLILLGSGLTALAVLARKRRKR